MAVDDIIAIDMPLLACRVTIEEESRVAPLGADGPEDKEVAGDEEEGELAESADDPDR